VVHVIHGLLLLRCAGEGGDDGDDKQQELPLGGADDAEHRGVLPRTEVCAVASVIWDVGEGCAAD